MKVGVGIDSGDVRQEACRFGGGLLNFDPISATLTGGRAAKHHGSAGIGLDPVSLAELRGESILHQFGKRSHRQTAALRAGRHRLSCDGGHGSYTVVGSQHENDVVEADFLIERFQQIAEQQIGTAGNVADLGSVRPHRVSDSIVRRKTRS